MEKDGVLIYSWFIAKIGRLSDNDDWINFRFVERRRIPGRPVKRDVRLYIAILYILNNVK